MVPTYIERLKKAEFIIKVNEYLSSIDQSTKVKFALPKEENIYFCTK